MALAYTYVKYKDTYALKNTDTVNLTYHVSKVTCDTTTEIKTGVLLPQATVNLNFVVDGNYSVYLSSSVEDSTPFLIQHYYNLITSFIALVEGLICGCSKCNECEECNQCEDYLGAFMKAQAFMLVSDYLYNDFFQEFLNQNQCLITEQTLCSLLHEKVYGTANIKDTMLYIIACYYLAFYFKDKSLAFDSSEQDYILDKYKFTKVIACMKKMGITPEQP